MYSQHITIPTLEVVEDAHVDLTLPQLEVLVDKHFFAPMGAILAFRGAIPEWEVHIKEKYEKEG